MDTNVARPKARTTTPRYNQQMNPGRHMPRVNVLRQKNAVTLEMALPGIAKEEVNIKIKGHSIEVDVTNSENRQRADKRFIRKEFTPAYSNRVFRFSENTDVDNIQAQMENGVLYITLPKLNEEQLNKNIEIK